MSEVAALLAASFLLSVILTRFLASPKTFIKIIDMPNARSLHVRAVHRTGGVAILTSLLFASASLLVATRAGATSGLARAAALDIKERDLLATLIAATCLAGVSLWDDRRHVSPVLRLISHSVAAAALMFIGNLTITGFSFPFFGVVALGHTSYAFTFLFMVWMTNLFNFMDGMDGFSGGMAVIGFSFLGAIAVAEGAAGLGVLALIIAASAGGFLVFNYPPARIFMGDVGAVPLGFLASALAVKGNRDNVMGLWVPVIIFSPFIVDATLVLLRRMVRGQRFWEPHREHYFQRLVLAGWSHRKTVQAEHVLMLGWGIVAVIYKWRGEVGHVVVLGLGVVVYSMLALAVRRIERRHKDSHRLRNVG